MSGVAVSGVAGRTIHQVRLRQPGQPKTLSGLLQRFYHAAPFRLAKFGR